MCNFRILSRDDLGKVTLGQSPNNNILQLESDLGNFFLVRGLTQSEADEVESEDVQRGSQIASCINAEQLILTSSQILELLPENKVQRAHDKNGFLLWRKIA
jgi:hypothetical protein